MAPGYAAPHPSPLVACPVALSPGDPTVVPAGLSLPELGFARCCHAGT